eukprot:MONOS_5006.1-p1 / transcript=MONOS_5006.1 / gene=MONOS_5006 / organism=Monocercomonoides_exilis_PA203 / gene_product=Protein disulfide-isomerase / transcript_product=Protein disulfide-isomerase / location=Mono_scaffold00141:952-2923(+) / protein_length=342 / sequence_SO=supercontig / SO=protein_coding / is_pseudo=false
MQMGAGQALLAIMETIMLCSGAGVFGDVCAGDGPCAVLLTAPWCGACGEAEAAVEEAREHFSGMAQNGTGLVRQVEFHVVRDAHRQAGRNQQLMVAELPALFVVEEGKAVPFEGMFTGPVVTEFVSEVVGKEAREIERETLEAMHRGGGAGGPSSIVLVGSDLGSSEALRLKRLGMKRGVLEKEKEKEEKEEEEEEEEKIEEEKKEIEGGKEEEEGEVEWVKSNVGVGVVCGVCGVAGGMILSRGSGSGKKERKKTREGKGGKEGKGEADTENEEDKDDDGDEDGDGDENEEEEEEEEGIKKKGKGEETENKKKKKKKGKEGKGGKERKEGKEGKGKAKEN